jgi:hypothetical protein
MSRKPKKEFNDYIENLEIYGMKGRVLRLPPRRRKTTEILMIYGHHAAIERMAGIAEEMNKYGAITLPDLPGLGGMQSFYKIGKKPTLDNYADYLATFIRWRYKRRRFCIAATSFGFTVVVAMLKKYPELSKQVDIVISFVGFLHKDELHFSKDTLFIGRMFGKLFSLKLTAGFLRLFILRKPIIKLVYKLNSSRVHKLKDSETEEIKQKRIEFEIWLWKNNDIRTHMYTLSQMLNIDLLGARIKNVHLHHIGVDDDHYFDGHVVAQHMNIVFEKCTFDTAKINAHAPTVIASAEEASKLLPNNTKKILRSLG